MRFILIIAVFYFASQLIGCGSGPSFKEGYYLVGVENAETLEIEAEGYPVEMGKHEGLWGILPWMVGGEAKNGHLFMTQPEWLECRNGWHLEVIIDAVKDGWVGTYEGFDCETDESLGKYNLDAVLEQEYD